MQGEPPTEASSAGRGRILKLRHRRMPRRLSAFARRCAPPVSRSFSIRASCGAGCVGSEDPAEIHDCLSIHSDYLPAHPGACVRAIFATSGTLQLIERTHHMAQQKPFLVPVVIVGRYP